MAGKKRKAVFQQQRLEDRLFDSHLLFSRIPLVRLPMKELLYSIRRFDKTSLLFVRIAVVFFAFLYLAFFSFSCNKSPPDAYHAPSVDPLTGNTSMENCGFEIGTDVPDGPIIDPCGAESDFLHGPVTLTPGPSSTARDSVILAIPEEGFICVTLTLNRIASATVTLNGEPLFTQHDFNASTIELNRVVSVDPPEALLDFEVRATPHGSLTYEVRYTPLDPVPRGLVTGSTKLLSIYNLRDHPDPFSPENQDGFFDTVVMNVTATVSREGISPSSANDYIVYAVFEIASPVSCEETARLTTQVALAEATPTSTERAYVVPLTVVWDGRDTSGAMIDGGTYFYRAAVELVQVTPSGSFKLLDSAYSEILTFTNDDIPPEITSAPANGELVETDMPFLMAWYTDDGSGVDTNSLIFLANGWDVTDRFEISEAHASSHVDIDWYLEEGENIFLVSASDKVGNKAVAISEFHVHTPTEVLLEDLKSVDYRYRQRSAYKLVCRFEVLTESILRKCLKQLSDNPETKSIDCILNVLNSGVTDVVVITLAADAIGEAFGVNHSAVTEGAIETLKVILFDHPSYFAKSGAARALGLTRHELSLTYLEQYLDFGPNEPKPPLDCDVNPIGCLQYSFANDSFNYQVARAIIRIAGQGHTVGNPGDLMAIRAKALEAMTRYIEGHSGNGGAP